MKKVLAFVLCSLFVLFQSVAFAGITTDVVREVTKTEKKTTISYPLVVKGIAGANEKINSVIGTTVDSLTNEAATLGGGAISYDIKKCDDALLSMTITLTPKQGVEETKGLTFERATGNERNISYYYNAQELSHRSVDGLKYLYDYDAKKGIENPDEYYVDEDNNIIGIYHAGAVLDKSEGEIEVNLSASDPVVETAPVTPPPAYQGDGNKGTITGTEVRMRSNPSLNDGNIVGYFEKGEVVKVNKSDVGDGLKWYNVERTNGTSGWVAADYCSVSDSAKVAVAEKDKKGKIVGTEVRMRSDPSLNGDILDYFDNGEEVTILDAASGSELEWTKVKRANGNVGWVASAYCKEQ